MLMLAANWFVDTKFIGNEIWRWFALGGILLASLVAGKIISFFLDRYAKRLADGKLLVLGQFCKSIAGPITLATLAAGLYFSGALLYQTHIDKEIVTKTLFINTEFWKQICNTLAALAVAWFIYRIVDIVEVFLNHWASKTETDLDNQLVPLVRKTLRIVIVIMSGLFIAQNIFHWDIGALLAGLGIGGLAFALAAKDMLANLFGSVTIFADRPFQMGERIKVSDYDGIIEEVGFRSTRIRTLFGHLITIPNSTIANSAIENISRRPYIKRSFSITVTYDTAPEKMTLAVNILKDMCEARKDNFDPDQGYRVYFTDFNSDSLGITVTYWFIPADWWEYCQFNHDFNMEVLEKFNSENIEFAFPTQTLYLKGEKPIDVNLKNE